MANIYKNAFFNPANTANTVIYAPNTETRAVIQNIQITNTSGNAVVRAYVFDSSNSNTATQIAYANISGSTIENIAKGPIILEESDTLVLSSTSNTTISGTVSILEINRGLSPV